MYFSKDAFMDGSRPSGYPPRNSRAPIHACRNGHGGETSTVEIGPFTKIPNKFFGSGKAAMLGPSASLLFLALCEHANRNSHVTFKASDKALASETTIAPRTICNARKKLLEYGLISYTRQKGQSYVYTLLKPSWEWKPLKERPRRALKPRALYASRTP